MRFPLHHALPLPGFPRKCAANGRAVRNGAIRTPGAGGRRIGCWASLAVLALLVVGLATLWFSRERIADNVISDMLADAGVPATYEIVRIGPSRQILRNIVVGDPARPDLTVERAEVGDQGAFRVPRYRRSRG